MSCNHVTDGISTYYYHKLSNDRCLFCTDHNSGIYSVNQKNLTL